MERIAFTDPETGDTDLLYVLEEAQLAGIRYLLVTEEETGDTDAYIFREVSEDDAGIVTYENVEDEQELNAVSRLFTDLLEDTVIE